MSDIWYFMTMVFINPAITVATVVLTLVFFIVEGYIPDTLWIAALILNVPVIIGITRQMREGV